MVFGQLYYREYESNVLFLMKASKWTLASKMEDYANEKLLPSYKRLQVNR
jgi:hypothetical protein